MNTENISEPMNQMSEKYQEMQHRAREMQRLAREKALEYGQATDDFVRENPWWIVGTVAATALIVGLLWGRLIGRD